MWLGVREGVHALYDYSLGLACEMGYWSDLNEVASFMF